MPWNWLYDWLTVNKLSVNIEKTCCMPFPRDKGNETSLCINNQIVSKVTSCRYLGVIIGDELRWTDHINHVYKQELSNRRLQDRPMLIGYLPILPKSNRKSIGDTFTNTP